jgi:beta-xylosidase
MKKTSLRMVVRTLAVMAAAAAVALFAACSDDTASEGTYTVSFNLGYETSKTPPASKKVEAGKSAGTLPKPVRLAWNFTGWKDVSSGKAYTKDSIINGDITLTAQWHFEPGPVNPIVTDMFTADPAAFLDDDGTAYIVCGEDRLPPDHVPSEYYRMPRWHMYSTTDMKEFKYEGKILDSNSFSFGQPNSAWASQAIKGLDGKYYFYGTVLFNGGGYEQVICVAVADNPTGPYEPVNTPLVRNSWVVADTGYSGNDNIDPTVFIDDDGSAYLSWGQRQPRIAKLKENMIEIERPIKLVFPPEWKTEDRFEEGPFLYKRNGIYYMIYASMHVENGSPVAETTSYATAPTINGPWTDGVTITGYAPGVNGEGNTYTIHPAAFDFNGITYFFYHNGALVLTMEDGSEWQGGEGRRSLCVDYMYFNQDGTIPFIDVRNFAGISVPPRDE